jgi:hypothetical protein
MQEKRQHESCPLSQLQVEVQCALSRKSPDCFKHVVRSFVFLSVTLLCSFPLLAQVTTTHVDDTDPSITYQGTWYPNFESGNSGGHATLSNINGARASITFTGTAISWIGLADPWSGFARVYLDGVQNTVDTYGSTTTYQKVQFTARGLSAGPHTLSIEVLHSRDINGSGSWVWIDGFDIENGSAATGGVTASAGRVEQNNPAINYNGNWYLNTNPVQSGGTALLSTDAGSSATISFTGSGIKWIAYRDAWSGIANVSVDGAPPTTVDTYSQIDQAQAVAYSVSGLAAGSHTLSISVAGKHNPSSGGSWIWVDAFDVSATQ